MGALPRVRCHGCAESALLAATTSRQVSSVSGKSKNSNIAKTGGSLNHPAHERHLALFIHTGNKLLSIEPMDLGAEWHE